MDWLLESLWHGSPLAGHKELKYDRYSKNFGQCFGKNDEALVGGSNVLCWDTQSITYK